MKHLEKFRNLFTTDNKKNDSVRIENEINSAIEKYNKNPEEFVKYDIDNLREKLLKRAKNNGFRGNVIIRKSANDKKSANDNMKFIIYEPKNNILQDLGSAAANARRK